MLDAAITRSINCSADTVSSVLMRRVTACALTAYSICQSKLNHSCDQKYVNKMSGLHTKPSAPILPLPDTLKVTSASQCSKLTLFFVHTEPL